MVYSVFPHPAHRPRRLYLSGLLAVLIFTLSGCGSWGGPPTDVVAQALNLRLQQTQQIISRTDEAPFSGSGIHIHRSEAVTVAGESAYRVEGTVTLQGRYRDRRYRRQTPFELYLAASEAGWDLLQPDASASADPIRWKHISLPSQS